MQPKNRKYRKSQKRHRDIKGLKTQTGSHRLSFGSYGLKSLGRAQLRATQAEAVRRVIIRQIRKIGQIFIRTFPHKPITEKPTKTRMGKGKGSVQYFVCPVKPGQIPFEIDGAIEKEVAKAILERAAQKLPVLTRFVAHNSAFAGGSATQK